MRGRLLHSTRRAAAGMLLFLGTTCSLGPHSPAIPWFAFDWAVDTIAGAAISQSAIVIPVTVKGLSGRFGMQLDTGSGWPLLYGTPYRQLTRTVAPRDTAVVEIAVAGALGSYSFTADTFLLRPDFGDSLRPDDSLPLIGTVGLRFFRHRILLLDVAAHRMAVLDSGRVLPAALAAQATFAPLEYHDGWAFVPLTIDGTDYLGFFYDTGANTYPLIAGQATWHDLTKPTPMPTDLVRRPTRSWGVTAYDVGAPARGPVVIAGQTFPTPLIFRADGDSSHPDFFATAPPGVIGLIGNALFAEGYIVILDLAGRRFGLLPRAAAPAA